MAKTWVDPGSFFTEAPAAPSTGNFPPQKSAPPQLSTQACHGVEPRRLRPCRQATASEREPAMDPTLLAPQF
jgi:hypothetical protein